MSVEDAKRFAEQLEKDKALRVKLREAQHKILELAREYGYEFTYAEIHDVMREKWGATKLPPSEDLDESAIVALSGRPGF
jgi:predicted ribosomally synthesized peptide with nif11-like leader